MNRWLVILVLIFLPGFSAADEFEFSVGPQINNIDSVLSICEPKVSLRCKVSLHDAWFLLNSVAWQEKLPGTVKRVRVNLLPGRYLLQQPLFLEWGGNSTAGISLEVSGAGKDTILSGAVVLDSWRPLDRSDPRSKIVSSFVDKIRVADVRKFSLPLKNKLSAHGFGLPIQPLLTDLYQNDQALMLARWPNKGYSKLDRPKDLLPDEKRTFRIVGRSGFEFSGEPDLMVHAFWFHDWASQIYPVSFDANGNFKIIGQGSHYGIKIGQRAQIYNALRELDSPGEWYLDRERGQILAWLSNVVAPVDLVVAEGGLRIQHSRNILLHDFVIEKTRGDAVQVTDSENVVFEDISIRHTGNRAIVISKGQNCGIRRALIEHNGEGAVRLLGGDRSILLSSGHFIEFSTIRDFSRLSKTSRFAVEIEGVGIRVEGNSISKAPHTAIMFQGNDHLIINNEIFDVVSETGDAGAIYTGRDFTARGTIIDGNFLHDIRAFDQSHEVKGVYLDDQASGITISNNIFARVQQPVFIGGGRDNNVKNNLFYSSSPGIHLDARGLNWQRADTLNSHGALQVRLDAVPYQSLLWQKKYNNLFKIRNDDFGSPKYNIACGNVVVKGKPFSIEKEALPGIELNTFQILGEDIFSVPLSEVGRVSRNDFRLKNGFINICS